MSDIPYLGLNPFSEKDAPFFFGRDEPKKVIARSLRISRLTLLFGESGVGKSSILQAGVVPQFRRDAQHNRQYSGTPQLAVVVFRDWHGENPLQELLEKIRASVAEAMGIKPTDLKDEPTSAESLQVWTEILGGEQGRGQLFLILDQFEEYFQSHPQESEDGTFADEFPRWVNRSNLPVNFLIAMRQDALAKLHRFQGRILNIFDNQIELKRLNLSAAQDAIVKPIREYNLRQIVADHFQNSRLTVLSAAGGMGKNRVLKHGVPERLPRFYSMRIRFCLLLLETDGLAGILFLRESQKVPLVTFSYWQGNPVADLVQQVEADFKALFPYISAPEPGTSLTETLQRWAERISGEGGNSQLFIILDQFEEFFQYQPPEMREGSFVAEFSCAVTHPKLPIHFLISIDDEARDLLKHFEERIPNIFDHLLQIKQLGENPEIPDLVKPIEEPAQKSSKAIDIEPKLVEEVLNQLSALSRLDLIKTAGSVTSRASTVIRFFNYIFRLVQGRRQEAGGRRDLVNYSAINYTSQENLEIEAPLLQLVMERLWTEKVIKKRSHCLGLKTLNDLSIPEKNITGAQRIANDHLSEQMQDLSSDRERNAMAIVFKYLVSGGGTKIAYPILQLPEPTGLNHNELLSVLEQLDAQRILRTVKVPNHSEVRRYEIFHDILAWPILNWRDRYLLDKKLKEGIRIGSLIGGGTLVASLAVAAPLLLIYLPHVNGQMKQIQAANMSIKEAEKIFKSESRSSGQIVGLITAMKAGRQFSELLNDKWLTLNPRFEKPINQDKDQSITSLKTMLENIREKNILKVANASILSVSFSRDGQKLAIGSGDGSVSLWNLQAEKQGEFPVSQSAILSVSFSRDGQKLAVGSGDGSVSLWNLQGKKEREFRVSQSAISSVSFNSDGQKLAIGSADGLVSLWNLQAEKQREFPVSSKSDISSVSVSGNGKSEFVPILSVSFSPDGQMLAIGFADGSVDLWNLQGEKQKKFLNFQSSVPVNGISFSSNRKLLATGSNDGTVRLWDIEEKPKIKNNDLKKLLEESCKWLDDYLETHSEAKDKLSSICENK